MTYSEITLIVLSVLATVWLFWFIAKIVSLELDAQKYAKWDKKTTLWRKR